MFAIITFNVCLLGSITLFNKPLTISWVGYCWCILCCIINWEVLFQDSKGCWPCFSVQNHGKHLGTVSRSGIHFEESNYSCGPAEWWKISLNGETKQGHSSSGHICECLSFTFFNFVLYLSHTSTLPKAFNRPSLDKPDKWVVFLAKLIKALSVVQLSNIKRWWGHGHRKWAWMIHISLE